MLAGFEIIEYTFYVSIAGNHPVIRERPHGVCKNLNMVVKV